MAEITMTTRPRLVPQVRLQWDPVREKQVLLIPEGVLVLNATGAAILALCDGQRRLSAIINELNAQYNSAVDQDVLTFLKRLAQKRVMVFDDEHEKQ
jgi:pyrroloquinoline quinone biosynthesis protein D